MKPLDHFLRWCTILGAGLLLLQGRFDWTGPDVARAASRRGYLSSAYFLILTLPTCYYTARALCKNKKTPITLTTLLALICVMPYHWLRIDRTKFFSNQIGGMYSGDPGMLTPKLDWFPAALAHLPAIPGELPIFAGLSIAALLALTRASRGQRITQFLKDHPAWPVCLTAYALILFQCWLHLSMRSPYTWLAQFEIPVLTPNVPHHWHHDYLFSNEQGAVEGDYRIFRACEELFQGTPHPINSQQIRRAAPAFFTSQVTFFINPFYAGLLLNIALWLAAAMCGYFFASEFFKPRIAALFTLLIATGSGFIFFADQPMAYAPGYAIVMILIYLFNRFLVADKSWGSAILYGSLFGLGLLTTDFLPFVAFIGVYSVLMRVRPARTFLSIVVACAVFGGFVKLMPYALGPDWDSYNGPMMHNALATIKDRLLHPNAELFHLTLQLFSRFAQDMAFGFLFLPLIPAVIGLIWLRDRRLRWLIIALVAPALLTLLFLHYGDMLFTAPNPPWPLAALPRMTYIAYPAIYLLAAFALARFGKIGWAFLAAIFIINNIDVFGFPWLYYHFYYSLDPSLPTFGWP